MREGDEGDEFTRAPLDPGRPSRSSGGARAARVGARMAALAASALLVVVVVVGLFAHATSDPGRALATLLQLPTATPTATVARGANAVYFSNGAPWGTLTIDGKRLPRAVLAGLGAAFSPGTHHLVYQARYFPSLRCVFSAPRAPGDTCPLDTSETTRDYLSNTQGQARAINLNSTGATLRSDQRDALIQVVNRLLAQQTLTTVIAPGDRYLNAQGQIVTASVALQFRLTLALDTSGVGQPGIPCSQFCPNPSFTPSPTVSADGWPVLITVTALWTITDAAGRPLTGAAYQAGQPYPSANPLNIGIDLTAQGWTVTGLFPTTIPAVEEAATSPIPPPTNDGSVGMAFELAPNPLDGCVVDLQYSGKTYRLFWRFGVLVTVNDLARQVFPHFTTATTAEQALANSIAVAQPHA